MKKRFGLLIVFVFLLISVAFFSAANLHKTKVLAEENVTQSFENSSVPSYWKSSKSALTVTAKRFKLGAQSLIWKVGENDSITVNDEKFMADSSSGRNIRSSGFIMWIYSEESRENEKLFFSLGDKAQIEAGENLTFSFEFNMNFKGWRALWVRLYEDSSYSNDNYKKHLNGTLNLNTMVISASNGLKGSSLYFDALEFRKNIFWNRAADYQLKSEKRVDDGKNEIGNWSGAYLYSLRTPSKPLQNLTTEDVKNFNKIEKRLNDWIFGTGEFKDKYINPRPNALKSQVANAKKKYDSLNIKNENGVWTGKPLFCGESPFVSQGERFTRGTAETIFLPLALDYKINGNEESLNLLMNLFDYWHDQGWAYGSGIGSLDHETLRASGYFAAVYVVKDELKKTNRLSREEETLYWYSEFGKVYPNSGRVYEQTTADEMRTHFLNRLFRVMLMENSPQKVQAMEYYVEWVNGALQINANRGDTIKPDFTGFHHGAVYMNAYPPHGYHMASMISYMLSGTKFSMASDARYNLKQALIAHDIMTNTATVPFQVRGRFPVQNIDIAQEILPSYAYMALSGDPIKGTDFDEEMAQIFMKKWTKMDEAKQKAVMSYNIGGISFIHSYGGLEVIFNILSKNILPSGNHEGFFSFPYAGMAIGRKDDWMVAVKGFSKYIWDFEAGTAENMFGRYSSYGMINVLSNANEVNGVNYINDISNGFDYNNGWNWNRFAGATAINLPLEKLHADNYSYRNFSPSSFLGSAGLLDCGVWGMDLVDSTYNKSFKAKKSVFMLDEEIVVLGSDIINNDVENRTETTLFQNAIYNEKLPIVVNGETVSSFPYEKKFESGTNYLIDPYNNGYFIPDSSGLIIERKTQNSLKADGKTASVGNYSSAYIDHGTAPNLKGYEYAMLINTDKNKMASYSKNKPYKVLKKDSGAHVVSKKSSGITAYSIFDINADLPKNGILQKTDTPILVISKASGNKTTLSISDPDLRVGGENDSVMQNSVMKKTRVTLLGKQKLLKSSKSYRIIETLADRTILEIDCIDGKSIEIELEGDVRETYEILVNNAPLNAEYAAGDEVTLESPIVEGKVFSYWSAKGLLLSEDQLKKSKLTFIMPNNNVELTANYVLLKEPYKLTSTVLVLVCVGSAIALIIAAAIVISMLKKRKENLKGKRKRKKINHKK